jgi:hypothetical protein
MYLLFSLAVGLVPLSLLILGAVSSKRSLRKAKEKETLLREATAKALETLREELRQERARHPLRALEAPPAERYETPQEVQRTLEDVVARVNAGLTPEFYLRGAPLDYHIRAPNALGEHYILEPAREQDADSNTRAWEVAREGMAPWDPNEGLIPWPSGAPNWGLTREDTPPTNFTLVALPDRIDPSLPPGDTPLAPPNVRGREEAIARLREDLLGAHPLTWTYATDTVSFLRRDAEGRILSGQDRTPAPGEPDLDPKNPPDTPPPTAWDRLIEE